VRRAIQLPEGYVYEHGFIKQSSPYRIVYDETYKARQSTNVEMSYLRLGWLCGFVQVDEIMSMAVVDVGSGNGEFAKCCMGKFESVYEYDVSGASISRDELYGRTWGLIVLSDVLEHFDDIDDLFRMKWKYCLLSFPETPDVDNFDDLKKWKHFKPGEHIYHLYRDGVEDWVNSMERGTVVVSSSNVEDMIRRRCEVSVPNITTMLIRRQPHE
jgi:hypothetical protein